MSKLFNNDESEENEILLSNIKQLKSNKSIKSNKSNISNNSSNKELKNKFKSNLNIPNLKISLKELDKLSEENEKEDKEKGVESNQKFERRKKKTLTIMHDKKPILNVEKIEKMVRRKKTKTTRLKKKTMRKQKIISPKDKPEEKEEAKEESEEFEDKEIKTKLELVLEKKFSPTETMLSYCKCQLFISYDNLTGFEYTGLEGILCVLVNRIFSNLYLQIYDIMDFKKQFDIELYTNIALNKGYEQLTEKFHTIEFPTFCLGLNFYTKRKADEIKNIILNYSKALNCSLFYVYEKENHGSFHNKKVFDYILNPKKLMENNEEKKKISNDINTKKVNNKTKTNINNNNKINDSTNKGDYLEQIFNKTIKKLNYKISTDEQMLSFYIDKEANEVIYETSKGANRFLEQNNIEISEVNEEYEKLKEKMKSKMKNNKLDAQKTKKSLQEEIKDKENKDKINDILNQIEGIQTRDKNNFNMEEEEEKQKLNNKLKKFNMAKRLPINQKLQINSSPDNMVFYEDDSESSQDFEEGEEIEDDDEEGEEFEDDEGNIEKQISSFNENNNKHLSSDKLNNIEIKDNNNNNNINQKNLIFSPKISIIKQINKNSSEISSNSFNENNNIKENLFNNKDTEEKEGEEESNKKDKSSITEE